MSSGSADPRSPGVWRIGQGIPHIGPAVAPPWIAFSQSERVSAGRRDQPGDAEDLSFETGAFDAITSNFGVMFVRRPEAAAEVARVCRMGGRIAVTTWTSDSTLVDMFTVMRRYMFPRGYWLTIGERV